MLRLLVIIALIVYIFSKLSAFLFRVNSSSQNNRNFQGRKPEGRVNVDSPPKKGKRGEIKGGEYVDFEEVK